MNDKKNELTTQDKNAGCYEYESDEEEDVPVFSHKLADVNEHGFAACDEDGLVWKYDRYEDEWRKTESVCDGGCDVCADEEEEEEDETDDFRRFLAIIHPADE